jgi:hypothetical protein
MSEGRREAIDQLSRSLRHCLTERVDDADCEVLALIRLDRVHTLRESDEEKRLHIVSFSEERDSIQASGDQHRRRLEIRPRLYSPKSS